MPQSKNSGLAQIYVANADDGTVSVIDVRTNTVVNTIDVGRGPRSLAVGGRFVYVAITVGEGPVSVIDTLTNTVVDTIDDVGRAAYGVAAR